MSTQAKSLPQPRSVSHYAVGENHHGRENRAYRALDLMTPTWICLPTQTSAVGVTVELLG